MNAAELYDYICRKRGKSLGVSPDELLAKGIDISPNTIKERDVILDNIYTVADGYVTETITMNDHDRAFDIRPDSYFIKIALYDNNHNCLNSYTYYEKDSPIQ